ncbi:MAG: TIM barrel protein [Candidatus Diapherotrites archaeon]
MIGISSSYFAMNRYNLFDSVVRAVELEFNAIELGAAHKYEATQWKTIQKISEIFPDTHFTVHGLFPAPQDPYWFNASLGLTPKNKDIIDDMFKAAKIVNAKIVSIHPGFLHEVKWGNNYYGMNHPFIFGKIPYDIAMKGMEEVLTYASEKAKTQNTTFAIENIDKSSVTPLLQRKRDFDNIFRKFPDVKFLFDYGHAVADRTVKEFLELSEKICEVHLHAPSNGTEHSAVTEQDMKTIMTIPQINEIPVILEHNTTVNVDAILYELEIVEKFLN